MQVFSVKSLSIVAYLNGVLTIVSQTKKKRNTLMIKILIFEVTINFSDFSGVGCRNSEGTLKGGGWR